MNKKRSLLLSIIAVLILGLIISSGTFAYFQWSSGYAAGTGVNVTIEMGGITMHIEPEETEFVGLYPTNNCNNKHAYGDALVTIVNNTGTLAIPSFKLKVRVTDKDGNGVPKDALKHINYSVVPIETTKDARGNPVKGEVAEYYDCDRTPSYYDGEEIYGDTTLFNNSNAYDWRTRGFFENVSTTGEWSHIPNIGDYIYSGNGNPDDYSLDNLRGYGNYTFTSGYLPRQYFIKDSIFNVGTILAGDVMGITFRGEAYSTSYQYFRVYVWIDSAYTTTIIGDTVSDPLQNAKIEITWSEESMVQQVSGESNVEEPVLAAGLYDENGDYTSWDDLVNNGDITVVNNVITASNMALTGELIIPEGITSIGNDAFHDNENVSGTRLSSITVPDSVTTIGGWAFNWSSLESIKFSPGSQLTTIGAYAFARSKLTSIEIPTNVTQIDWMAFYAAPLTSISYNGTVAEWNEIELGDDWNLEVYEAYVKCLDGEVLIAG